MRTLRLCVSCLYPLGFSLLIAWLLIGTGQAESPGTSSRTDSDAFTAGVQAYRRGDYPAADRVFGELHKQAPQEARVTYYLAITAAQQGRFQQAGRLYRDVIRQEPEGSIATLAREGLKYLPPEQALDQPPRFSTPADNDKPEKSENNKDTQKNGTSSNEADKTGASSVNGNPAAYAPGGMSPQDWMMLQMMMNSGNGGNGGNAAWGMMAPWMMTPSAPGTPGTPGSTPAIDPEVMKTMLMNQLMQGFDLGGSGKDDRN
jgi:hypothetical protein